MLSYVDARPHEMLEDLINDVYQAFNLLESDKENQFLRRSAVKAVFAFIECVPYTLKYKLRTDIVLKRYDYQLTKKEEELLYEFDNYKISLLDNFKNTFKLTKKVWGLEVDLKTDSKEYQILRSSIFIRDKITHPKRYSDIIINDKEVYNCLVSFNYIRETFSKLMKSNIK